MNREEYGNFNYQAARDLARIFGDTIKPIKGNMFLELLTAIILEVNFRRCGGLPC